MAQPKSGGSKGAARPLGARSALAPPKLLLLLLFLFPLQPACTPSDRQTLLQTLWQPLTGPRKLSGTSAFRIATLRRNAPRPTDLDAITALLTAESAAVASATTRRDLSSPVAERLVAKLARSRLITDTRAFARDDATYVAASGGLGAAGATAAVDPDAGCGWNLSTSDLASRAAERLVPALAKLPVRNQGQRGTCAAFAAVGAIEQHALRPGAPGANPLLPTLDLSEQRFYWLSKPECQDDGCPGGEEGSWYGMGLSALRTGSALPLESECPYIASPGSTDTYSPQPVGCVGSRVKLQGVDTWCGINELLDLLDAGYAVPFASRLSANWEDNDGLITAADAAAFGTTSHAVGHAYLVVGYRRLPDMPSEGGLCLWVRNSWGTGWGNGGYACMTLAWVRDHLREHQVFYGQPIPAGVALDDDLAGFGVEPEAEPEETWDEAEDGPLDDDADEVVDPADDVEELEPLEPEADLDPDSADERDLRGRRRTDPRGRGDLVWVPVDLWGPNEAVFAAETAEADDELLVRAVKPGGIPTKALRLLRDGAELRYQGDVVGRREGEALVLCSEEFAALCALRHRAGDDQVYVQFRDEDRRAVRDEEVSDAQGAWYGAALGLELFVPHEPDLAAFLLDPKTYVRVAGGKPSRLSLRPSAVEAGVLEVRLGGLRAGRLNLTAPSASSLCSGADAQQCNVWVGDKVQVVPSNRRRK